MRKYFLVIFLLLSVVLIGCSSDDKDVFSLPEEKIAEMTITCTVQCQENQLAQFKTMTIDNEETMLLFKEALENGEAFSGLPMYIPEFEVLISFSDGSTMEVLLALGNDREEKGSFVFEPMGGFVLPIQDANHLRDLLLK